MLLFQIMLSQLFDVVENVSSYAGYLWLIIAVVLLFLELGTPGLFFFIAFAIGSCFSAAAAFFGVSLVGQCLIGLLFSLGAFVVLKRKFAGSAGGVKTNSGALVGKQGIVLSVIEPHKKGAVKVNGERWPAIIKDDHILQKGTLVVVEKVRGNTLLVTGLKDKRKD